MSDTGGFRLLAYPEIDPPYELLAKGLLYADQLGTLTPNGYRDDLRPAFERELYEPLSPWEVLDNDVEFLECLSALIDCLRTKQFLDPAAEPQIIRVGKLPDMARQELLRSGATEEVRGGHLVGDRALVLATLSLTAHMVAAKRGDGWVSDTNDQRIRDAVWAVDACVSDEQQAHKVPTASLPIPAGLSVTELLALRDRESNDLIKQIKATARTIDDPTVFHGMPGRLQQRLDVLGYKLARSAGSEAGLVRAGASSTLVATAGAAATAALTGPVGAIGATVLVNIGTVGQAIIARRRDHMRQVLMSNVTG